MVTAFGGKSQSLPPEKSRPQNGATVEDEHVNQFVVNAKPGGKAK